MARRQVQTLRQMHGGMPGQGDRAYRKDLKDRHVGRSRAEPFGNEKGNLYGRAGEGHQPLLHRLRQLHSRLPERGDRARTKPPEQVAAISRIKAAMPIRGAAGETIRPSLLSTGLNSRGYRCSPTLRSMRDGTNSDRTLLGRNLPAGAACP